MFLFIILLAAASHSKAPTIVVPDPSTMAAPQVTAPAAPVEETMPHTYTGKIKVIRNGETGIEILLEKGADFFVAPENSEIAKTAQSAKYNEQEVEMRVDLLSRNILHLVTKAKKPTPESDSKANLLIPSEASPAPPANNSPGLNSNR